MRTPALAATLAVLLAACAATTPGAPPAPLPPPARVAYGATIQVTATPLPLNPRKPAQDRVGDFRFAGSLDLTSPDSSRLHGLSDLKIVGDRLYSISDDGADAVEGRIVLGADGRLAGLADVHLAPLKGEDGRPLQGKTETDAEGLALMANGDRLYSLERHHRILRYSAAGGPPTLAPMPPVAMPDNEGMEGLAAARHVGPDAYWVGIEGGSVWLCRLSAACDKVEQAPRPPLGYRLSALGETPAGDLVLLHHLYNPLNGSSHIQVSILRSPLGKPRLIGRFRLDPPMTVDNFEGVDIVPGPHGGWRIYLLVDDNFSASEKTILEAFDWTPPR